MLSNYLKIAVRNLKSHKLYSAINICGLAVGLAACLLIGLFVQYEFSYDDFVTDADRVYRVSANFEASSIGAARRPAGNVAPFAPLIANAQLSGIESIARIGGVNAVVTKDDSVFTDQNLKWVDAAFFDIVTLAWLQGDKASALNDPYSVVLSVATAARYFGDKDPLGQTLLLENRWPVRVTGIVADLPDNSHLQGGIYVSMTMAWSLLGFDYSNTWGYDNFHTYIKLRQGAAIEPVMAQINDAIVGAAPLVDQRVVENFNIKPGYFSLTAYALSDIHLGTGRRGEFRDPGSMSQVLMFSAIAASLLLIACINFMNLTTARATQRVKEVGMRKAIGADFSSLLAQFLGESVLLSLLALLFALGLSEVLVEPFGAVLERKLVFASVFESSFVLYLFGLTLATGLLAGAYPAFYLASFKPSKVLSINALQAHKSLGLRNVLVVFQFSIAIVLIVATAVVSLQMRFVQKQDLGFHTDNILLLRGTSQQGLGTQWQAFKQRILQYPQVVSVTEETLSPLNANNMGSRRLRLEGGVLNGFDMLTKPVGFDFFTTYDIALVEGRLFNADMSADVFIPPVNRVPGKPLSASYIVNAAAARQLGLSPQQIVGRNLEMDFSGDFSLAVPGPIVGVVEDVHLQSLREAMQPVIYFVQPSHWGDAPRYMTASIRLNTNDAAATVALIRDTWNEYNNEVPFMSHFLQTDFDLLYQDENKQRQLFQFFALLTIAIACLGLYGLAAFTVERRRKEIGVRKVMGGSVWSIVLLLTNEFSKLVLLSNLLAWPVAYFAMNRWLENFAYRIDLTPLIFIGSGLIALCIAWVTVGGTAAKAASQKPVLALRYE
jgi:putative ABC transport system permease protein